MILIVSSKEDLHIPHVTEHLQHGFKLLDVGDILNKSGLTYFCSGEGQDVSIKYAGSILSGITGIWLRRPRSFDEGLTVPVKVGYQDYCRSALRQHLNELYAVLQDALWVSDRFAIERAEHKMYQLQVAKRVGLNVPATTITSSPEDARSFIQEQGGGIVKKLSGRLAADERGPLILYAQRVTADDPAQYEGLHLAPSIFQQTINPGFDIRVTVVGNMVFAAKVLLEGVSESNIRDWHIGHQEGSIRLEEYKLPKDVAQRCVQLVKDMGLQFGALDFVQDQEGKIWFIEINPNGQWAFVEEETGQPIGKALAALLEGRHLPSLQKYAAV